MYKRALLFLSLFFSVVQSFAQNNFRVQAAGCYFTISITDKKGNIRGQKHSDFEMLLEVINYDSVDKFFPVNREGEEEKIMVNFSDFSMKSGLINFYIGTCKEEMFPFHCYPDSFLLKKLAPKEKIVSKYVFKSSRPLSNYISQMRIDFVCRFIDSNKKTIGAVDFKKVHYVTYINKSNKVFFSFNSDRYNEKTRTGEFQ